MAKFYFRVLASDHATYIYCIEAPDQEAADEFVAADSDVLESKAIQAEDVPPYVMSGPS
jgi:hypothetical protein